MLERISHVFSVFHDGTPEYWRIHGNTLSLKVSCLYLAELISPEFEYFFLEIREIRNLQYLPWEDFKDSHPELTVVEKLNRCFLEIIDAKVECNRVTIICHEHNSLFDTPGGNIVFEADGITIKSEDGNEMSIEQLLSLGNRYWEAFARR